jgi:CRP-like cAMP-binding protein
MSDDLAQLLGRMGGRGRAFAVREFLFRRDDPVRSLFLMEAGEAHLVRFQPDGGQLVLQRAGPGQIVAEASVFSPVYHCDAIALTPTKVLEIDRKRFRSALLRDERLAESWNHYLAREVQTSRLRAEMLSLKTVSSRLDAWLNLNLGILPDKGEWKRLATQIGVTPEALYRELAKRNVRRQ